MVPIFQSTSTLSTKLRLYNTCLLPICLYGSECWAITKEDACRINALHQSCLRMLLSINSTPMMTFDARPTNPYITEIIQERHLSLFGHIARMDDYIDAKQILTSSPSVYWKRPPRRLQMKTQNDLDSHGLSWSEAVVLAQNRPLWRLLATSGATHL